MYWVKDGAYLNGEDSEKESSLYLQRLVATLYYNAVGLFCHHLNKVKGQNDIWNLIPIEKSLHDEIDGWKNFEKGFNKAIEYKKELQIKQFYKTNSSRWSLASDEGVIFIIIKLKASGMNTRKIIKRMQDKVCEKKVREYLRFFYFSEEFLEFLESQSIEEFLDLYTNLDSKWMYVVNWEMNKDKNLQEFEALIEAQKSVSNNPEFLLSDYRSDEGIDYGYMNVEDMLEELF